MARRRPCSGCRPCISSRRRAGRRSTSRPGSTKAASVGTVVGRELQGVRSRAGVHDEDGRLVVSVRVRCPVAYERDAGAVGRPRRSLLGEAARREGLDVPGGDVQKPKMPAARSQVTVAVLLELVAVDDDRRRGLAFPALLQLRLRVGIGILDFEDHLPAVGRPGHTRHAALDVRDALRVPSRAIEEPHLGALLLLLLVAAGGEKGQIRAGGVPAGFARTRGPPRQADLPEPVPAHHPEIPPLPILLLVELGGRVRHPLPFRRDLNVRHGAEPGEVFQAERARRGFRGLRGGEDRRGRPRGSSGRAGRRGDDRKPSAALRGTVGARESSRRRGYTRGRQENR